MPPPTSSNPNLPQPPTPKRLPLQQQLFQMSLIRACGAADEMNTKSFSRGKIKILKSGGDEHANKGRGRGGGGVVVVVVLVRLKGNGAAAWPPSCPGSDDEISCFPHQVTINLYLMGAMVLI